MAEIAITRMADHEKGGILNWKSYTAAQQANGERCDTCACYLTHMPNGKPRSCFQCQDLKNKPQQEVNHDLVIRCQNCRHLFTGPQTGFDYNRDRVDVYCPSCDHEFEVCFEVSVSFTSPKVCEHEWEEIGGASDEDCMERYERCKKCKAERTTETPREPSRT